MKRALALACIRIAGYHGDKKQATRIFCEHRMSRPAFDDAWDKGVKQKAAGMRCSCPSCLKGME